MNSTIPAFIRGKPYRTVSYYGQRLCYSVEYAYITAERPTAIVYGILTEASEHDLNRRLASIASAVIESDANAVAESYANAESEVRYDKD